MIFFYALGGGLGHFLRARAAIRTLFQHSEVVLLTSTRRAKEFPAESNIEVLEVPPELLAAAARGQFFDWLNSQLRFYRPSTLCVDAFPSGLFGEVPSLDLSQVRHRFLFARLLNFPNYEASIPEARFCYDRIFICETLLEMHQKRFARYSESFQKLELIEPETFWDQPIEPPTLPFWIVDHSGSLAELYLLVDYARDLKRFIGFEGELLIATTETELALRPRERLTRFLYTPLLYPLASQIFTGAGFHAMKQAEDYASKHVAIPFERKFDEQFIRAAMYAERRKPNAQAALMFAAG